MNEALSLLESREFLDSLYGFAYKRTRNSYEAEDLCSEIILAVMKAVRRNYEIKNLLAFIWTVAHRVYADFSEKNKQKILDMPLLSKHNNIRFILWALIPKINWWLGGELNDRLKTKYFANIEKTKREFYTFGIVAPFEQLIDTGVCGSDGNTSNDLCGYKRVFVSNIYGRRVQRHFYCGENISKDPLLILTIKAINGLALSSLTEKEIEVAAKAIEVGYLKKDGDTLYPKILVSESDKMYNNIVIVFKLFTALCVQEIENVNAFIWRVAHNTLANYYRGRARNGICICIDELADILQGGSDPAENIAETETINRIQSEIAYLSKMQRKIVIMYYFESKKQEENEIADCLGVSPVYVESETEFLEEYGFLTKKSNKYLANMLIDEPNENSHKIVKLQEEMYVKSAKIFANELYDEFMKDELLDDENIVVYNPLIGFEDDKPIYKKDKNFMLWSLIPYVSAVSGEKLMDSTISFDEVATIRPDGGKNIAYAGFATTNGTEQKYFDSMLKWCGPCWNINDNLKSPFVEAVMDNTPDQLKKMQAYGMQHIFFSDGWFLLYCMKELVENGKLSMPKEEQKKSLTTIIMPK